jgi:4-amino-4-deoxy-L-arabinose transferase-like glycosyltransferase
MVKNKNYVLPTVNGKPHISKSVLFYWMDAFSMKTFGKGKRQARLPSAVFSLLLILATYLFIRRISSKEFAFYSALLAM